MFSYKIFALSFGLSLVFPGSPSNTTLDPNAETPQLGDSSTGEVSPVHETSSEPQTETTQTTLKTEETIHTFSKKPSTAPEFFSTIWPDGTEWCAREYQCDDVKNILCRVPDKPDHCSYIEYNASETEIVHSLVLGAINTFRDQLAAGNLLQGWPAASNMRQLVWDKLLELEGYIWDTSCSGGLTESNPCPAHWQWDVRQLTTISSATLHQKLKKLINPVRNVHQMLLEIRHTKSSIVPRYTPGKKYNNFARIAHAEATIIGCSMTRYNDCFYTGYYDSQYDAKKYDCPLATDFMHELVFETLRCSLAPRPQEGFSLYHKGVPCSRCPDGTACKPDSTYRHLCARPEDPENGLFIPLELFSSNSQGGSRSSSTLPPSPACVVIIILSMTILDFVQMSI